MITLNTKALDTALSKAFQQTCDRVNSELKSAIVDPIWDYPRQPSPRDIVDTGALRDSQQMVVEDTHAEWTWDVPYAIFVHEGVTLRSGTVIPPRRWTQFAVDNINVPEIFADSLAKELQRE